MATNVEAKGGELVIKSPEGHFAIIKSEDVTKVQELIDNEKWDEVNSVVNAYPSSSDYAEGGSLYVGGSPTDPTEGEDPVTEINYDTYLGETKFNSTEDLDRWNLQMQGKVGEDQWDLGQTPYQDLTKAQKFSDKYYGAGAKRFSELIGEEAVTDIRNKRQSFLDEGVPTSEITDRLSAYAIDTYGDKSINKEDIYGDFGPRETSIINEADSRLRTRRGLYGDATKANTAGTLDTEDTKFGFRNFINPQFIQNQQNYKDIWQLDAGQQVTLQKRTNQNAKGGYIKAEKGLTVKKDPPEKSFLESAGDYASEAAGYVSNLFGSSTDKKAKKLEKAPEIEGTSRLDISNYPQQGLTDDASMDKFFGSTVTTYKGGEAGEVVVGEMEKKHGCLGSSCRASEIRNKELASVYNIYEKYNLGDSKTEHPDTESAIDNNTVGFDSWEVHQALRNEGVGNDVFTATYDHKALYEGDPNTEEYQNAHKERKAKIKSFDINDLTVGTVIGGGDAVDAGYINEGGKSSYRNKKGETVDIDPSTQKSRHTMTVVGFDDKDGAVYVYDYGTKRRIPRDKFHKFMLDKDVNYITSIKEAGDWTFKKLKEGKAQIARDSKKKTK